MSPWISAARPRTLPLALCSIGMGSILAARTDQFNWIIFLLACLTTILLQVLSNFANDYGDTQNGADTTDRIGPARAVQSGEISAKGMLMAIRISGILTLLSGISLLYFSFKGLNTNAFWAFLGIGLVCILAAYTYTAGKKPYGYAGLGDLSVLLFFGIVGVLGSNFLFTHRLDIWNLLPALCCGFLAMGVLNLNNIRDIESDRKAGKLTIPARVGRKKALCYHWFLLLAAMACITVFSLHLSAVSWLFLVTFPLFILNGIRAGKLENPDPLLKQLALSSLVFVNLFGISVLL